MEKYKNCELDIVQLFDENIDLLIQEAFSNLESESITKLSNTQWKYVLSYIGFRLFPDNRLLFDNTPISPNTNIYDYNIIYNLTLRYIILCYRYNKIPSVLGLSLILNIPISSIKNWNNSNLLYNATSNSGIDSSTISDSSILNSDELDSVRKNVSPKPLDIFKLLASSREDVLKDIAIDSKQVVGALAVANSEFGWNVQGNGTQVNSIQSLSASELPLLPVQDDK